MAITSYSELKLAVANWLGVEELTNRIPEFIALAEDRIAKDLRIQAMETTANLTVNTQRVSQPTGFLEVRRLYLDSSPDRPLEYFSPSVFWGRYAASLGGEPRVYTIEGTEFVFGPSPDSSYTGKLLYYKRFTALSVDADTNWIFSNARGIYLYGALLEAYTFLEDDAGQLKYAAMFDQAVFNANESDRKSNYPRGALPMRSQVAVH